MVVPRIQNGSGKDATLVENAVRERNMNWNQLDLDTSFQVSRQTTLRFNKQLLFRNCAQIGRFPRRKNGLWKADCALTKNTVCPGVLWFNVFGFKRTASVESSFNSAPQVVYIVLDAQMTLQLVSIPMTNMRIQATGAESALIALWTVVRVVILKCRTISSRVENLDERLSPDCWIWLCRSWQW